MAKYATDEPSENWGEEFHVKFARWESELHAYEQQELSEVPVRRASGVQA